MNNSELPRQFKTWVHFWDAIIDADGQFQTEILLLPDGKITTEFNDFIEVGCEYKTQDVKDLAFEELLSERFEYEEAKDLFMRLSLMVYDCTTKKTKKQISKLKRIILTQSKKKMEKSILKSGIEGILSNSQRYKTERGEISMLAPCYATMNSYEIYCIDGALFEDIERYDTLEEAEERINELLLPQNQ